MDICTVSGPSQPPVPGTYENLLLNVTFVNFFMITMGGHVMTA